MLPIRRRRIGCPRGLSALLIVSLSMSLGLPTPGFALRAAGLEENAAKDEVTRALQADRADPPSSRPTEQRLSTPPLAAGVEELGVPYFEGDVDLTPLQLPEWTQPIWHLTNDEIRLLLAWKLDVVEPLVVARPNDTISRRELLPFLERLRSNPPNWGALLQQLETAVWASVSDIRAPGAPLRESLREMSWLQRRRLRMREAAQSLVTKLANMTGVAPPAPLPAPPLLEVQWDRLAEQLTIRLVPDYSRYDEGVLRLGPLLVKLSEEEEGVEGFSILGDRRGSWSQEPVYTRALRYVARHYTSALETTFQSGRVYYRRVAEGPTYDMGFAVDQATGHVLGLLEGHAPEMMDARDPNYSDFRDGIFDMAQLARAIVLKQYQELEQLPPPVSQEQLLKGPTRAFPSELLQSATGLEEPVVQPAVTAPPITLQRTPGVVTEPVGYVLPPSAAGLALVLAGLQEAQGTYYVVVEQVEQAQALIAAGVPPSHMVPVMAAGLEEARQPFLALGIPADNLVVGSVAHAVQVAGDWLRVIRGVTPRIVDPALRWAAEAQALLQQMTQWLDREGFVPTNLTPQVAAAIARLNEMA